MLEIKISRYVNIPVFIGPTGDYIPIWDSRLEFIEGVEKGDVKDIKNYTYSHPSLIVKGIDNYIQYELTEVIFDLMTKTISQCIEVDLYPISNTYKVGEEVYIEESPKVLSKATIKGVVYKDSSNVISKGRYINDADLKSIKQQKPEFEINDDHIYCVNRWYPSYVLDDDRLIEFTTSIYKKQENHHINDKDYSNIT